MGYSLHSVFENIHCCDSHTEFLIVSLHVRLYGVYGTVELGIPAAVPPVYCIPFIYQSFLVLSFKIVNSRDILNSCLAFRKHHISLHI